LSAFHGGCRDALALAHAALEMSAAKQHEPFGSPDHRIRATVAVCNRSPAPAICLPKIDR
jgi:hypothetical protein